MRKKSPLALTVAHSIAYIMLLAWIINGLAQDAGAQPPPPCMARASTQVGWDGPGLGSATLTYCFRNSTADLPVASQRDAITRALRTWSRYVQINFVPTTTPALQRSLDIFFKPTLPGDFARTGGYAYFPDYPDRVIAGDIHVNDGYRYPWDAETLNFMALHEVGHALGLNHSTNEISIMAAAPIFIRSELTQDDINRIRTLYATRIPPAPANDRCGGAVTISSTARTFTHSVNNTDATDTGDPRPTCVPRFLKGIWYKFTPAANGRLVLTTRSDFITGLAIYNGSCSSFTPVACHNGGSNRGINAYLDLTLVAGRTYWILGGSADGVMTGLLNLHFTFTPGATAPAPTPTPTPPPPVGPANNHFANARVLTGTSGRVTGTNVGATREAQEPIFSGNGSFDGKSIWYKWTSPGLVRVTFTTAGSSFNTLLLIAMTVDGTGLEDLYGLAANDDAPGVTTSSVTFVAGAGKTYYIEVDGFNGAMGNVVLNWSSVPQAGSAASTTKSPRALRSAPQVSPVQLSTMTARAAPATVQLTFDGPLSAAIAGDTGRYDLRVNGRVMSLESTAYHAPSRTVLISLPEGSLHTQDQVTVQWHGLLDSVGAEVASQVRRVTVR